MIFTRKPALTFSKFRNSFAGDNLAAADLLIAEILGVIDARVDLTSRPQRFILVREYLIAYAA
jgi:hypothetical protein